MPLSPCCLNSKGLGISGPGIPCGRQIFLQSSPQAAHQRLCKSGLVIESIDLTWTTTHKREITLLARGLKCGCFGSNAPENSTALITIQCSILSKSLVIVHQAGQCKPAIPPRTASRKSRRDQIFFLGLSVMLHYLLYKNSLRLNTI